MYTQKDKQERGAGFEREFRKSINYFNLWGTKLICDGLSAQPFDYAVTSTGKAYAFELKRVLDFKLPYSAIRQSQREGLTEFENKVKTNVSIVLVNIKNETTYKCFYYLWRDIKDDVCSGRRGSLDLSIATEVPTFSIEEKDKKKKIIDLSSFERGLVGL